ncbi:hypothetical protein ABTX85_37630 [Streptomyces sp. NPDC096097]|uniref:hypothetical protein n=1 Tax=Streptomyces sp. NPDC096097 TaxID=3155546 RepID=UPI00331FECD2
MSRAARLLTTSLLTSVLSGVAAPLGSAAYAAPVPAGIGWDVAQGNAAVSASGLPANGIGWD